MKTILLTIAISLSILNCEPCSNSQSSNEGCDYDVYQGGVIIDTIHNSSCYDSYSSGSQYFKRK